MIEVLGAEPVEYAGSHKCCGFPVITMNRTTSLRQAGRHLADAIDAGADCLVTPCPLCHLNLDMQQPEAAKFVERDLGRARPAPAADGGPGAGPRAQGAGHGQARGEDRATCSARSQSWRLPEERSSLTENRPLGLGWKPKRARKNPPVLAGFSMRRRTPVRPCKSATE